jgi:hypothetical protein
MIQCCECRSGEHSNYDNDVRLTIVKYPDTNELYKRGYICGEHRAMFRGDGYIVKEK